MMSAYAHKRDHGSVLKLHAAMDGLQLFGCLDYFSDTCLFVENERWLEKK